MIPCNLKGGYQLFKGTFLLHLLGRNDYLEDGSSKFFQNVGTHMPDYNTVSLSRRSQYESVLLNYIMHKNSEVGRIMWIIS
jgi:hypothetical protein